MPTAVVACAPFKGTLSAFAATRFVARAAAAHGFVVDERPMPDGGEGTADVLGAAWQLPRKLFTIPSVLGQATDALTHIAVPFGERDGRVVAILESAACVGLTLVPAAKRDPLTASTHALGHLLAAALAAGADDIFIALGGTATVDGGRGLLDVVGALPAGVRLTGLVDVWAPLAGPRGARSYFAQKGLAAAHHADVEARLCALHPHFVDVAGAGAAGGLGAAVLALGGALTSGAEAVLAASALDEAIRVADVVIGGEGCVDETTTQGKSLWALRAVAARCAVPLVVVCGRCDLDRATLGAAVIELVVDPSLATLPTALGRAINEAVRTST